MISDFRVILFSLLCIIGLFCRDANAFRDSSFQHGVENVVYGASLPSDFKKSKGIIIWFHGGMSSSNPSKGKKALTGVFPLINREDYIIFSPSAHRQLNWLHKNLIANINSFIYRFVKTQKLEEIPLTLVGVSDGCLGVIHFSMNSKFNIRKRLLFSSAPQLILPENNIRQDSFQKGSWHFFQGGKDRLFPIDRIEPYLRHWVSVYPNSHLHIYPLGEHDFSYYLENHKLEIIKILNST